MFMLTIVYMFADILSKLLHYLLKYNFFTSESFTYVKQLHICYHVFVLYYHIYHWPVVNAIKYIPR